MNDIPSLIKSGRTIIQVITDEEDRACEQLTEIAKKKLTIRNTSASYFVYSWSVTTGLINESTKLPAKVRKVTVTPDGKPKKEWVDDHLAKNGDPMEALRSIIDGALETRSIVIMKDFHLHLKAQHPIMVRLIKEAAKACREKRIVLIIVGCSGHTVPELNKIVTTIDMPLPNKEEVTKIFDEILKDAQAQSKSIKCDEECRSAAISTMCGMTAIEVSDAIKFAILKSKKVCLDTLREIKIDSIKRTSILEFESDVASASSVGGLASAKAWIKKRVRLFSDKAKEFGASPPKGVLVIGISGTGKSLITKSVAKEMNVPMLRLEGGRIFAGMVGESEKNMRNALKVATAMAPCVLFIDELEKAMVGLQSSGQTDSGVSARVIGLLLQWMQDQTGVMVVATANDISKLPPEMLRRGRFDQIFFVDLPTIEERKDIWKIHIKKANQIPDQFDITLLASKTEGYTGAEIECVVKDGMTNAFAEDKNPSTEIFLEAIKETIPLSITMSEKIAAMRKWADGRAIKAA